MGGFVIEIKMPDIAVPNHKDIAKDLGVLLCNFVVTLMEKFDLCRLVGLEL